MLVIQKKQMQAMEKYMQEQFEDRMVVHLQTRFPDQTGDVPEPELRENIRSGIKKARTYDVTKEHDVRRYLEYAVLLGNDFDSNPSTVWPGAILRTPGVTGRQKMDRIDDHYTYALKGQT